MVRNFILASVFGLLSMSDSFAAAGDSINLNSPFDTDPLSKIEYNLLLSNTYEKYKNEIDENLLFNILQNINNYKLYEDCSVVDPENPAAKHANSVLATYIFLDIFDKIHEIDLLHHDDIQKMLDVEGAKDLFKVFKETVEETVIKPAKH